MQGSLIIFHVEVFVFLLGFVTFVVELALSWYFVRMKAYFAGALAAMCLADALATMCTLIFAYSSVLDIYAVMPPAVVACLRIGIFASLLCSSLYLLHKIRSV